MERLITSQQQGRQANKNGQAFENDILSRLKFARYEQMKRFPEEMTIPFFIHQYRSQFIDLCGKFMRVDFYVWHPDKHPRGLIIQAKYQETGGSADEKLPFALLSLERLDTPALLAIQGDGFKHAILQWCRDRAIPGHLTVVTQWNDLQKLFNKGWI